MTEVTVPEAPGGSPVRWSVVVWRVVGCVAIVFAAAVASVLPLVEHWWNSSEASLECEEIAGWTAQAFRGGWAEGSFCRYTDPVGRTMDSWGAPTLGPPNWFEPRTSFVVTALVLVIIWGLALVAIWFIWHTGRARRLPRDAGRILVA